MLLSNNNKTSVLFTSGNFTRTTLVSKLQMLELKGSNCGSLHCLIVSCHKQCVLLHLSQIYCCKIKILAVVSIFQGQNPSVTDSELLSKIKNTWILIKLTVAKLSQLPTVILLYLLPEKFTLDFQCFSAQFIGYRNIKRFNYMNINHISTK